MINRIFTLMLIALCAASCSKSEPNNDTPQSSTAINFATEELAADWSRGEAVSDINTVPAIMVYAFLSEPNDVTSCYINNEAAVNNSNVWSFNPARHYPLTEKLDFLAYAPTVAPSDNGLDQELDFPNKAVKFSYETPLVGRNHPDFMVATPAKECDKTNKLGTLNFQHALTQVSMSAKVASTTEQNRYIIKSFTFHDIATKGEMTYNVESGMGAWIPTLESSFIVSAMLPNPDMGETQVKLTNSYQPIMSNGHTLMMIPQPIESKSGNKAMIDITIYDTNTDSKLTYCTDDIPLVSYQQKGWLAGQHINLQFEFDVTAEDVVLPMSLTAQLKPWVEQVIDEDIDANIYAFLSNETISGNTTLTLYTNGVVKSATPDRTVITDAALGTADSNGYYPIAVTTGTTGVGSITVEIENSNNTTITKTFNITVK